MVFGNFKQSLTKQKRMRNPTFDTGLPKLKLVSNKYLHLSALKYSIAVQKYFKNITSIYTLHCVVYSCARA